MSSAYIAHKGVLKVIESIIEQVVNLHPVLTQGQERLLIESYHIEMFCQFALIRQKVCYFTYFVNVGRKVEKDPKVNCGGDRPQLHTASIKD